MKKISGGSKKGHPFYGNQHTKISKYSRNKRSGSARSTRKYKKAGFLTNATRHFKKYPGDLAVGALAVGSLYGVYTTGRQVDTQIKASKRMNAIVRNQFRLAQRGKKQR